jgi:glycosyltransferase involved in cell wall biosynthesis
MTMNTSESSTLQDDQVTVTGKLDHCEGGTVYGWAVQPDLRAGPTTVDLLIDGVTVATSAANIHRPDVEAAGFGDGRCGFALIIPAQFFDSQPHSVEVREIVSGKLLDGGPAHFREGATAQVERTMEPRPLVTDVGTEAAPPAPQAEQAGFARFTIGQIDECRPDVISGWAARADGSLGTLAVELVIDGNAVARSVADLRRGDLEAANVGTGRHGFRFMPPDDIFDDEVHVVLVRELSSNESLTGSPAQVRFNACEYWDRAVSEGLSARRVLAERALSFCESASDERLDDAIHQVLIRMQAWLLGQSQSRLLRRVHAQLDRLTALRCELKLSGFIGSREIGGTIEDRWSASDATLTLDLLQGDAVIGSVDVSRRDGTGVQQFVFVLPEGLRDDNVHRFEFRLKEFRGSLGTRGFLVPGAGAKLRSHAVHGRDSIWDTLPATLSLTKAKRTEQPPDKVEVARAALAQALEDEPPAEPDEVLELTLALAEANLAAGNWAEALARFGEARTLDPASVIAIAGVIRTHLAAGSEMAAQDLLDVVEEEYPDEREFRRLRDELTGRHRLKSVRTIAFYLPQFHPTPENNEWWGQGFTEWSNVGGAIPWFTGHLQPRRPTSLGYYDLRLPEAANAQFELAKRYGIDGFCYYYYWFEGRRILQKPLDDLASGRTGPFPFCVCWANEDWTRSWDGSTGDVMLAQNHNPASDFAFIQDVAGLLRHPGYIRVDGKPVLLIYRADKLAKPKETVARWREWCRTEGIGELHLCAVQSFGFNDPRPLGFDAAVEFPPHCAWDRYPELQYLRRLENLPGTLPGFRGTVYDYQSFAHAGMRRPREPYALHRTAMIAWDNTARRQQSAAIYHQFSIDTYERWVLSNARKAALEQDDAICFVNAWNEWAEGSVMEPDVHFGYEVLESTRSAKRLANFDPASTYWRAGRPQFPANRLAQRQRVLLVGHDAFPSGAQTNLLNMARCLKRELDIDVTIFLIEGGDLLPDYERVAPTFVIGKAEHWQTALREQLRSFARLGACKAIANTVITADVVDVMKQEGFRVVGLLHELPTLIDAYGLQPQCWRFADKADAIVSASEVVAGEFADRYWPDPKKLLVAPQGIAFNGYFAKRDSMRRLIREELGLGPDCLLMVGCGYGDTRKGIDLFVQVAGDIARRSRAGSVAFLWIGALDAQLAPYILADIERLQISELFRCTGRVSDAARFFIAGDVFTLTSREDPFPSVVMEAFDACMPVIAFDGGGGYVDIVNSDTGALVPYLDVSAMAQAVNGYLADVTRRTRVGASNHSLCRERFGYAPYMRKLLALLDGVSTEQVAAGFFEHTAWHRNTPRPRISAIVPNFNYAQYLELRLRTIIEQTLPPDEIIVLDDASSDGSLEIINAMAATSPIPFKVISSATNSGNPFVQWAKGLSVASGDLIWIAEADDYCEPTLLESLAPEFDDPDVVMSWSDSIMVDGQGHGQGAQYKNYYAKNYGSKWSMQFRMDGQALIDDCLLTENVIPNASAVLFRRSAVKASDLNIIQQYRFSGDWWFWLSLAREGAVVYNSSPVNYHRRHAKSVMGDVLRSGDALLPETIAFYQRVAQIRPECVTPHASLKVLNRLQRLFEMFPSLTAVAADIADHPALSRAYGDLTASFSNAGSQHSTRVGTATLVLSKDVLSAESKGAELVHQFNSFGGAFTLLLLAPSEEASNFIKTLNLPNLTVEVIATNVESSSERSKQVSQAERPIAEIEQALHTRLGERPAGLIATHGLLAACLVASVSRRENENWTLLGGSEFDTLLGRAPTLTGVTIERVRDAVALAGTVRYLSSQPPHALARIASAAKLPLDQFEPEHGGDRRGTPRHDRIVRLLGIASQASGQAWRAVARRLRETALSLGERATLRLLTWEVESEDVAALECEPNVELIRIFAKPASLQSLADAVVFTSSQDASDVSRLVLEAQRASLPSISVDSVAAGTGEFTQLMQELLSRLPSPTLADSERAAVAGKTERHPEIEGNTR